MGESAERVLFDDYRYYRNQTASIQKLKQERPYVQDLKETPERLALMRDVIAWCEGHKLNPREWIYELFAIRKWLFCPPLKPGVLMSDNVRGKRGRIRDYRLYKQRVEEQIRSESPGAGFDPNRDISPTAEGYKAEYLSRGKASLCMDRMATETFGYHPKSPHCQHCPARARCLERLRRSVRFDVIALREGKITSKQARDQALARVQSYADRR